MNLLPEQRKAFEEAARPLMKYINENFHPHTLIILDHRTAQLFQSEIAFNTDEYLKD